MKMYDYMQTMEAITDTVKITINKLSKSPVEELAFSCGEIVAHGFRDQIVDDITGDYALLLMEHQARVKFPLIERGYKGILTNDPQNENACIVVPDHTQPSGWIYPDFVAPKDIKTVSEVETPIRYTSALLECFRSVRRTLYKAKGLQVEVPVDSVLDYDDNGEEITVRSKVEQMETLADQASHYLPEDEWQTVTKVLDVLKKDYPKQHEDAYKIIRCMINGLTDTRQIAEHLQIDRKRIEYIIRTFKSIYLKLDEERRRVVTFIKVPTWKEELVSVPDEKGTHLERVQVPSTTYHKVDKVTVRQTDVNGKLKQTTRYYDCFEKVVNPKTGKPEPLELTPVERTKSKSYVIDKGIVAKGKAHWHTVYSPSSLVYRGIDFTETPKVSKNSIPDTAFSQGKQVPFTKLDILYLLRECKTPEDKSLFLLCKEWFQGLPFDGEIKQAIVKASKRMKAVEEGRFMSQVWTGEETPERKPVKMGTGARAITVYEPETKTDKHGQLHLSVSPLTRETATVRFYDGTEINHKTGTVKAPRVNRLRQEVWEARAKSDTAPFHMF